MLADSEESSETLREGTCITTSLNYYTRIILSLSLSLSRTCCMNTFDVDEKTSYVQKK